MITTKEVAKILGVTSSAALQIMKYPDCKEGTKKRSKNFYKRERVEAKVEERRLTKSKVIPKNGQKNKICPICKTVFIARPYQQRCNNCIATLRINKEFDPEGIMIKPRYGTRHCSVCGTLLMIGQRNPCSNCRKPIEIGRYEDNYIYE